MKGRVSCFSCFSSSQYLQLHLIHELFLEFTNLNCYTKLLFLFVVLFNEKLFTLKEEKESCSLSDI